MTLSQKIQDKLKHCLPNATIILENDSGKHAVPKGSESHFKLTVVATDFSGQSILARQRLINTILQHEFQNGLHALALTTLTPEEWDAREKTTTETPPCLGGTKHNS